MQLTQPFLQLPIRFCAETLAAETRALPAQAWVPHPQGFAGNEAVRLVTPEGKELDRLRGPMAPTSHLLSCPYIMEVMSELGAVWGRGRLMGLGAGADVPPHVDKNYYWRTHLRIHIPVITNPGVLFTCDDETIHMAAGECWLFDSFRRHGVQNTSTEQRIHLVLDTVGGEGLWELMNAATHETAASNTARKLAPGARSAEGLEFERFNAPKVMSPWEIRCHLADLSPLIVPDPALGKVMERLDKFTTGWTAAWARFGTSDEGLPTYRRLIDTARDEVEAVGADQVVMRNGRILYSVLEALVFTNAILLERPGKPGEEIAVLDEQRLAS